MRKRRIHIAPQHEFGFTVDTFNLFLESGTDGERVARELAAQAQARAEADRAQVSLFATNTQPTATHD